MWVWEAGSAWANDIEVGGLGAADIESALDIASPGDRLLLHGGSWFGSHRVQVDGLSIESWPGEIAVLVVDESVSGSDARKDGAFQVDGVTLTLRNLEIDGQARYRLARIRSSATLTLDGVVAYGGKSDFDPGGGFGLEYKGTLVVQDSTIRDCWSSKEGGAVDVSSDSTLVVASSRLEGNSSNRDGGAVSCHGACTFTDSSLIGNSAQSNGGAVAVDGDGTVLRGNWLCGNSAGADGGGLDLSPGGTVQELAYNIFFENSASYGGAIWTNGSVVAQNNDFIGNIAQEHGAALRVEAGAVVLVNSLLVGHLEGKSVVSNQGTTVPLFVDSIDRYGNTVPEYDGLVSGDGTALDSDPQFVSWTPGNCETSDLRPLESSPTLEAGNPIYDRNLGALAPCIAVAEVPADGVDQDCDGTELCYQDLDGDGYGGASIPSADRTCLAPGLAVVGGDCDDQRPDRYPGATEVPVDGLDQDCDGTELCYQDQDRDGAGGPVLTASADPSCAEDGVAPDANDCDDARPEVHPGAAEVACNERDDDCDPTTPDVADLDGDLSDSCTDCDDGVERVHPGAPEVCDGLDNDCDGTADEGLGSCEPPASGETLPRGWFCSVQTPSASGGWAMVVVAMLTHRRRRGRAGAQP